MMNLSSTEIDNISCGVSPNSMVDGIHTKCMCKVTPKDKFFTLQEEDVNEKECQEMSEFIINENIQCFFYSAKYLDNDIVIESGYKAIMQKQDKDSL